MNKTILLLLTVFTLGTLNASAQKIQEQVDKAAKDPKRTENAAKADVYIHKKRIADSIQPSVQPSPATTNKKKSKKCHKS